jgi:hypothetical protein
MLWLSSTELSKHGLVNVDSQKGISVFSAEENVIAPEERYLAKEMEPNLTISFASPLQGQNYHNSDVVQSDKNFQKQWV